MSDPFYVARSRIEKGDGFRRAKLVLGRTIETGVHGPVKEMYKLHDLPDVPLPVDYIAAATGA